MVKGGVIEGKHMTTVEFRQRSREKEKKGTKSRTHRKQGSKVRNESSDESEEELKTTDNEEIEMLDHRGRNVVEIIFDCEIYRNTRSPPSYPLFKAGRSFEELSVDFVLNI